ncbi:adenylate/guanylate cyclase domain-containing protein [Aquincola sp. MAHUQ-54]|uniref:Adenylate/guanylate cyclase domain-containing protein n=1 Tax=Aquincola agrisoli TaxID=3119538 RepID=A0AAW9QG76_9BURK
MNAAGPPPAARRRWRTLLPALGLALLGLAAMGLAPVLPLESSVGLRVLFALRGTVAPPADVVVVAIDERSAAALGLPERPRQWPRRLHADLLRSLHAHGARLVAFDLTFDTPTDDDAVFAEGLRATGRGLLTSSLRSDVWEGGGAQAVVEQVLPAVSPIGESARAQAPFVLPKDARVDAYWTFRGGADHTPSLPVLAFHLFHPAAVDGLRSLSCAGAPAPYCGVQAGPFEAAGDPAALVRRLRERLWGDPAHAAAVSQRLQGAAAGALPAPAGRVAALLALHRDDDVAYLNYYGPARSVRTVSYADVDAAAAADPALFRGKMVFVGFSAQTAGAQDRLRDDYRTVFSDARGVDVSGVEIAATAFANLQEDRVLRPLPAGAAAWVVAGWGVVLGLLASRLAPRAQLVAMAALAAAYAAGAWAAFGHASQWWPLVVPLGLQWPAAVALGLWLGYRRSRGDHHRMQQAFGYFLPRHMVEQLAGAPGQVASAYRLARGACLFTDAERYTALAEQMDPQSLGDTMNRYYACLFEPVERHGGWVVDVVGDAIVAVWDLGQDELALRRRSCEAALDMQAAIAALPVDAPSRLPTRIGLHCGEMRIGTVGAGQRYDFRAVGDAVNTASRLEGLNKLLGTRILASAQAVEGLEEVLLLRPVGAFRLAGKREAVDVVEVLARQAQADEPLRAGCSAFATGLARYRRGEAAAALPSFAEALAQRPDDGPAAYYLQRCQRWLRDGPDQDPAAPVTVATK